MECYKRYVLQQWHAYEAWLDFKDEIEVEVQREELAVKQIQFLDVIGYYS